MEKLFEIYFSNLDKETQEELLSFCDIKDAKEMNWDTVPVACVPKPEN